ncbi:DUF6599 family protein [Parabacteroides sp.]
MRGLWIRCCLFLCFPLWLWAQDGVQVKRERVFTGSGLYGFMNGGAEQFLEYGVSRLTARDVVYKGEDYTIEIYEMPTAEDAFGIYSLHVFKCQRADTLGCIDCLSPYQLQAVVGDKYVSVVFPSGFSTARDAVDELIRLYLPMDGKENPRIPEILGVSSPYSGSVKYLRGPISVSGASMSLAKMLEDYPFRGVWFVADKTTDNYRALIYLKDKDAVKRLEEKIPASSCIRRGEDFLYIKGMEEDAPEEDHGDFGF